MRRYPADDDAAASRERLHQLLAEAREQREDPVSRAHDADTQPEDLRPVPGSGVANQQKRREPPKGPPRTSAAEVRAIVEKAVNGALWLELSYHSLKDDSRRQIVVVPERIALNREGAAVLVATDTATQNRLSYAVAQIERARTIEPRSGA